MTNAVITLRRAALVAAIVAGATGCGIRTGQLGASAPVLEGNHLQPAPEWVVERLAQTAFDVYFDLNEDTPHAAERDALARIAPALGGILGDFPDLVIVLEGHCDDRGSTRLYCPYLGIMRRAPTVRAPFIMANITLTQSVFPALTVVATCVTRLLPVESRCCRSRLRRVNECPFP
jgi:hypothetical protein